MHKPSLSIQDFSYQLPDERIAKYPLAERDQSKLLIYKDESIRESKFKGLSVELPPQCILVFNNTKVIQARLKFEKETGAEIELFCLEPIKPIDIQQAFESTGSTTWKCIVGNARKWKDTPLLKKLCVDNKTVTVSATKGQPTGDAYLVTFDWDNKDVSFVEIIEAIGRIPIPPYLKRESEEIDSTRYQTVYSQHKGSVAAPTAGLHFTPQLLEQLKAENHEIVNITLHVGAGTFKPVKAETIDGHEMHTEHFVIEKAKIETLLKNPYQTIAVGTTTVRTLESLYWFGVRILENLPIEEGVQQWDPYNLKSSYTKQEALQALALYMAEKNINIINTYTSIIIVPGYSFKMINGLITNFHQPQSTLLLLIAALIGDKWHQVYQYALDNNYRFLSYGDSSLLFNREL